MPILKVLYCLFFSMLGRLAFDTLHQIHNQNRIDTLRMNTREDLALKVRLILRKTGKIRALSLYYNNMGISYNYYVL